MDGASYRVEIIEETALPPGVEWCFAEDREYRRMTLFLKRRAAQRATVLTECWAAYRAIAH